MQAKPQLNGRTGWVESFDQDKDRYHVRIGGSEWVDVRPHNVILPKGARPIVRGLTGAAHYNGRVGHVLSYDDDSGRYVLELWGDGDAGEQVIKTLKLKRESAVL